MSGFQQGGGPYGPPPPAMNYAGQFMPQYQGHIPYNNNMVPSQQPLLQPQYAQSRPQLFPPQVHQAPNQVHFANNASFNNNHHYPQPGLQQGPPLQQPHFYNYGPYNNASGPPYTPNMQNQGFNAGLPTPLNVNANAIPTSHFMNAMQQASSPPTNTPTRPTFTPQQFSPASNPFERRDSDSLALHNHGMGEQQVQGANTEPLSRDSTGHPFAVQSKVSDIGPPEDVVEPVRNDSELFSTGYRPEEDVAPREEQAEPQRPSNWENKPQLLQGQKFDSVVRESSLQRSASMESSKEDLYVASSNEKSGPLTPTEVEIAQESRSSKENTRSEKREGAKQALLELNRKRIGFLELSSEGLDLELLRGLYLESGIQVSTISKTEADVTVPAQSYASFADNPEVSIAVEDQLGQRQNSSLMERSAGEQPLRTVQLDSSLTKSPASKRSVSPVALPKSTAKSSTPTGGNKAMPTESTEQTQGRKDYIAKLLAAKAGIRKDPAGTQTKPSELESTSSTQIQEDASKATPPSNIQTASEAKKSEMKDPKQTELIRQRLEALMNAKNQQTPQNHPPSNTPQAQQLIPLSSQRATIGTMTDVNEQGVKDSPATTPHSIRYDPSVSFFAPSNRTSSGGLPGLPGLSGFPLPGRFPSREPQMQPQREPTTHAADESGEEGEVLSEVGQARLERNIDIIPEKMNQVTTNTISLSTTPDGPPTPENLVANTIPPESSRKRPMAADFIDSPPRKLSRRNTSEPIHLVIEVSDNGDEGTIDDQLQLRESDAVVQEQISRDENSSSRKSIRELPPLSNPPKNTDGLKRQTKMSASSLAQHEEDIRLMRLRIAEAEQRKKTKNLSDTLAASDAAPSPVPADIALARTVETKQQAIKEVNEQLAERERALAKAKKEIQEKLETERRNQARVAALAEKERQEASRAASAIERQVRLSRKATLEDALPRLDAQINAANAKLEDMKRQQDEIQAEIRRGNEGRETLINELSEILKALETDGTPPETLMSQNAHDMAIGETSRAPSLQAEHGSTNSAVPPASTPVPPKIIIPHGSPADFKKSALPTPQTAQTEPSGEIMDIASSSEDEGQIIDSGSNLSRRSREDTDVKPIELGEKHEVVEIQSNESMDDYEPDAVNSTAEPNGFEESNARKVVSIDRPKANDDYEPSLEVEVISSSLASSPRHASQDDYHPYERISPSADSPIPYYHNEIMEESRSTADKSPSQNSLQEEGEVFDGEMGSDDYEPPEPSFPLDDANASSLPSPVRSAVPTAPFQEFEAIETDAEARRSPDPAPGRLINNTQEGGELDMQKESDVPREESFGHFTPYESPLRNFSSYRFHPQYVGEIPGGFHSLTFNHKIKSNEVLCRWELAGGVCNDQLCSFQHFRDLPLTDNNLLLQLGSVHEGSTREEREAYISGLKRIIAGMRDKNLKDVTAIASEIVAYRSRFLKDPSRIIINI